MIVVAEGEGGENSAGSWKEGTLSDVLGWSWDPLFLHRPPVSLALHNVISLCVPNPNFVGFLPQLDKLQNRLLSEREVRHPGLKWSSGSQPYLWQSRVG